MSLITLLDTIPDHRRRQGRRYQLGYILVCSVLSILCGSRSYRDIERFMQAHLEKLNHLFGVKLKRAPAHTTIRGILTNLKKQTLELYFREHAQNLSSINSCEKDKVAVAVDGKVLRGSFDHMSDKKALNLISAYCTTNNSILGHIESEDKSNEIPAVQDFLNGFGLKDCVYTMDALHCQKKQ